MSVIWPTVAVVFEVIMPDSIRYPVNGWQGSDLGFERSGYQHALV